MFPTHSSWGCDEENETLQCCEWWCYWWWYSYCNNGCQHTQSEPSSSIWQITVKEAEYILTYKPDGTFLVREEIGNITDTSSSSIYSHRICVVWVYMLPWLLVFIVNPASARMREGYGTGFVCRSFILSTRLQRSTITSKRQLRYEQAKHDHGLQCDSWILQVSSFSRYVAHLGSRLGLLWRQKRSQ